MPTGQKPLQQSIQPQQEGEEQLFDQCFRDFYPALCQFASTYLKNEESSADLVQDCFLKLWETGTLSEKQNSIPSFLYAVVRNRCIDVLRRKSVQNKRVGEFTYLANQLDEEEISEVTRSETIRQLFAAIEALPADLKEVVREHYFEGKKYDVISATLGLNYNVIRKKKARAIVLLKRQLLPLFVGLFSELFYWIF